MPSTTGCLFADHNFESDILTSSRHQTAEISFICMTPNMAHAGAGHITSPERPFQGHRMWHVGNFCGYSPCPTLGRQPWILRAGCRRSIRKATAKWLQTTASGQPELRRLKTSATSYLPILSFSRIEIESFASARCFKYCQS